MLLEGLGVLLGGLGAILGDVGMLLVSPSPSAGLGPFNLDLASLLFPLLTHLNIRILAWGFSAKVAKRAEGQPA